ncbi:MAG: hypothetical protein IJQ73_15675 [Kiritimatiellae bacterium]|nr:hypothetical protein [Kiritimatiellia bacterium]
MAMRNTTTRDESDSPSIAATSHRAYLLGEQHSVSGIQELRGMLHSEAPNVRRLAASAFEKLADLNFDKQPVVRDLVDVGCTDAHPQARQYALKALKRYVAFLEQYEARIAAVAQDHNQKDYVQKAAKTLCDLIMDLRSNALLASSRRDANSSDLRRQCKTLVCSDDADAISAFANEKGITRLVHFTTTYNLISIIKLGEIMSRSALEMYK